MTGLRFARQHGLHMQNSNHKLNKHSLAKFVSFFYVVQGSVTIFIINTVRYVPIVIFIKGEW
jgi:hypothetical protein